MLWLSFIVFDKPQSGMSRQFMLLFNSDEVQERGTWEHTRQYEYIYIFFLKSNYSCNKSIFLTFIIMPHSQFSKLPKVIHLGESEHISLVVLEGTFVGAGFLQVNIPRVAIRAKNTHIHVSISSSPTDVTGLDGDLVGCGYKWTKMVWNLLLAIKYYL